MADADQTNNFHKTYVHKISLHPILIMLVLVDCRAEETVSECSSNYRTAFAVMLSHLLAALKAALHSPYFAVFSLNRRA